MSRAAKVEAGDVQMMVSKQLGTRQASVDWEGRAKRARSMSLRANIPS